MTDTMTEVRDKGSGSIFKRDRDGRWVAQVEAGYTVRGARRYITKSAKTEAEAKRLLRQMQNKIAREGIPAPRAGNVPTIKRWSDTWLPIYQQKVRPNRFTDARGVVRRYIVPTLGRQRLDTLTPAHVRALHKAVRDAGFGPATELRAHDVLMVMLKAAQLENHPVPANVLITPRPEQVESDRSAIPTDDAVQILQHAAQRPDAARWVAALLQGMRQAECLGLTWECIDLDAELLDVSWQLQRLPYEDRAAETFRVPRNYVARRLTGATHLVRPKSTTSRRVVPLVPWMTDALRTWKEVAPENPWGLVWTEGGRPLRKITDRDAWQALQEAADVRHPEGRLYTLHEARHTTATLLLEAGVDGAIVKEILGHSSVTTTRGYQHVSTTQRRRAMEKVANMLRLSPPPA